MRAFIAFLVVASLALAGSAVADDYEPCEASFTRNIAAPLTFGCSRASNIGYNRIYTWVVDSTVPITFEVISWKLYSAGLLQIIWTDSDGTDRLISWAGRESRYGERRAFPAGKIKFKVYSDRALGSSYHWSFRVEAAPPMYDIDTGVLFDTKAEQSGGFIYFALRNMQFGSQLGAALRVFGYNGLQAPKLFAAKDRLPTLEDYDFRNSTESSHGEEVAYLFIDNPASTTYYFGMKLYGRVSHAQMLGDWTYDLPELDNGVNVASSIQGEDTDYYHFFVPRGCSQLELQTSRQIPGGEYMLYLAAGVVPTKISSEWDTEISASNDYDSVHIPRPNPKENGTIPNAGEFLIGVQCRTPPCGYILQAAWATSLGMKTVVNIAKTVAGLM